MHVRQQRDAPRVASHLRVANLPTTDLRMPPTIAFIFSLLSASIAPALPAPADTIRTDAEIRAAVLRHSDDVRKCYENEGLKRNPRLEGLLEVEVTILPTGLVEHATATIPSLKGEGAKEVAKCLAVAAKNWRFD